MLFMIQKEAFLWLTQKNGATLVMTDCVQSVKCAIFSQILSAHLLAFLGVHPLPFKWIINSRKWQFLHSFLPIFTTFLESGFYRASFMKNRLRASGENHPF